jgi:hypothetical protein
MRTAGVSGGGGTGGGIGGGFGEPITAASMGMHIGWLAPTTIWGDYDAGATAAYHQVPVPSIGIGTLRLWDSDGCTWRNIERTHGVFSWSRLDNAVALAEAAGAEIVYTLGCGPDWATTNPGQMAGLYVGYNPWPPSDNAYWTAWCTAVGTRYAGKGIKYEIWNEVNDQVAGAGVVGSGFMGTVAQLVTLAALAKAAISAVDPTAQFLTPNFVGEDGIVSIPGAVTLDAYLAAGGAAHADIVSVHGYNTLAPWPKPEGMMTMAKRVKDTCAAHGVALPIWNTEWGYGQWVDSTGDFRSEPGSTPYPDVMSDQMGADYITRMLILSWCGGFQRFFFYGLDAVRSYATIVMVNPTSGAAAATVLLAGDAYSYFADLMVGGYLSGLQKKASPTATSYYSATFTAGDGRRGYPRPSPACSRSCAAAASCTPPSARRRRWKAS